MEQFFCLYIKHLLRGLGLFLSEVDDSFQVFFFLDWNTAPSERHIIAFRYRSSRSKNANNADSGTSDKTQR